MSRFRFLNVSFCAISLLLSTPVWAFKDSLFQSGQGDSSLTQYDRSGIIRVPHYKMWSYDQDIRELYRKTLARIPPAEISKRIEAASGYFLNEPYLFGALGEGLNGDFDQKPLYRTEAFDCMTYVSTILALAESKNLKHFKKTIIKMNYKKGLPPSFATRHHFMSIDWNPANQSNGYLKDITSELTDDFEIATTPIDKANWFRNLTIDRLALIEPSKHLAPSGLLNMLHADADQFRTVKAKIDYIPLSVLFKNVKGKPKPNRMLFDKIPSGTVIELIDVSRDLKKKLGTNMDVFHMGFAIKTSQGLMFRSADRSKGSVTDVPMEAYLISFYQKAKNKSKIGINIQKPLPPYFKPTDKGKDKDKDKERDD